MEAPTMSRASQGTKNLQTQPMIKVSGTELGHSYVCFVVHGAAPSDAKSPVAARAMYHSGHSVPLVWSFAHSCFAKNNLLSSSTHSKLDVWDIAANASGDRPPSGTLSNAVVVAEPARILPMTFFGKIKAALSDPHTNGMAYDCVHDRQAIAWIRLDASQSPISKGITDSFRLVAQCNPDVVEDCATQVLEAGLFRNPSDRKSCRTGAKLDWDSQLDHVQAHDQQTSIVELLNEQKGTSIAKQGTLADLADVAMGL